MSMLNSTLNTRAILPNNLRYIRSDVPDKLTEQETEWLLRENITTIVDLRTADEREKRKCPLAEDNRFRYLCMPVTGGNVVPESVDEVSKSYIAMADKQMKAIITAICEAETNVLYFCNAGKDRTGVVSAILLAQSGMDEEYIVRDYLESKENLRPMLESFTKQCPQVDIHVITPDERYMKEFLTWLRESSFI